MFNTQINPDFIIKMTEPANQIEGILPLQSYEDRLKILIEGIFPHYSNTKLEDLHKEALNSIESEDIQNLLPDLISVYVDSSNLTLSELSRSILNKLTAINNKILISSDDISANIHKIATRKNYGRKSKNQYEDKEATCLWCWELFQHKQPGFILRERTLIGNVVKVLDKLIQEMKKESPKLISELFSNYNKNFFCYENYKSEQNEKKRKRNEEIEGRSKRTQEKLEKKRAEDEAKKVKIEEERRKKAEENLKKKDEEKKKAEERRKIEEDKRKAKEEKRKEEEEKKKEIEVKKKEENIPKINNYFTKAKEVHKNVDKIPGEIFVGSSPVPTICRQNVFIYFADSHLKPYFTGPVQAKVTQSMLTKFTHIDYNIDSEEEYEELNGEDLESNDSEEEEESESSSEIETFKKFIVDDGHLSEEEKLENEEIAITSVWMNNEIKPMSLLLPDDSLLLSLKAITITSEELPIILPEKPVKVFKEPKPAKTPIDEIISKEIIQIALGKFSKDEILSAVIQKFPNISKAAVKNLVKVKLTKQKTGPKNYILKPDSESNL